MIKEQDDTLEEPQTESPIKTENNVTMETDYEDETMTKLEQYEHIVEDLFSSFKQDFRKNYDSSSEHEKRKNIFRHNMR